MVIYLIIKTQKANQKQQRLINQSIAYLTKTFEKEKEQTANILMELIVGDRD
jgi:hypothetical protein